MQKVPKDGDPPGQHSLFVNEYSTTQLLSSDKLPKDDAFEGEGLKLVKEWAKLKSLGAKAKERGGALRAKQEEEQKRKEATAKEKADAAKAAEATAGEAKAADEANVTSKEPSKYRKPPPKEPPKEPGAEDIASMTESKKWPKKNMASYFASC